MSSMIWRAKEVERMLEWIRTKLLRGQRPPKETMLILFLSGILIFVILLPTDKEKNSSYQKRSEGSATQTESDDRSVQLSEEMSLQEYKDMLETELEEFLSGVSGVGEVNVLIYMKASWEYRVEKDNESSADMQDEETVYTVNEYGQEVPFITKRICPQIDGVVVMARGAANEEVRVRLVRLIMALYGLEANKVEVIN